MDLLWLLAVLMVGVNTLVWGAVGLGRALHRRFGPPIVAARGPRVQREGVAMLVPAHNEELVIADTIRSACEQVAPEQVFVVSDGSGDGTAEVARGLGAEVLELSPNRGKAGAIVEAIAHFRLAERFEVVVLLDADTRLDGHYLETGLPAFDDPAVVVVAGRATTNLDPPPPTRFGRLLVAYRERFYVVVQYLLKYGQAARRADVVSIAPGFASMYRASVLEHIDIAVPGLVIEDFNMTFEVHAKRLGRIAFDPGAAVARTQDPDTLHDYRAQMWRWTLGFWQTVRLHRKRRDRFWFALGLYIVELVLSSAVFLVMLPLALLAVVMWVWGLLAGEESLAAEVARVLPGPALLAAVLLPDLLLTLLAAGLSRDPAVLRFAPFYPMLRAVDAVICLRTLVAAMVRPLDATGRWASPSRRPVAVAESPPAAGDPE